MFEERRGHTNVGPHIPRLSTLRSVSKKVTPVTKVSEVLVTFQMWTTKLLCRLLQSLWLTVLQNVNADTGGEDLAKCGKNSSNRDRSGVYWPKTLGSAQRNCKNLSLLFTSKCWVIYTRDHTCSFHDVAGQCSGGVGLPQGVEDRREQGDDDCGNPMICAILAPWKRHKRS